MVNTSRYCSRTCRLGIAGEREAVVHGAHRIFNVRQGSADQVKLAKYILWNGEEKWKARRARLWCGGRGQVGTRFCS